MGTYGIKVGTLAYYSATENPNFDRERFLKAAGVN